MFRAEIVQPSICNDLAERTAERSIKLLFGSLWGCIRPASNFLVSKLRKNGDLYQDTPSGAAGHRFDLFPLLVVYSLSRKCGGILCPHPEFL